jgi:hypothetical protein
MAKDDDTAIPPRPQYIPNKIDDPNYVRIFDTTLRDGEQSPGATLTRYEQHLHPEASRSIMWAVPGRREALMWPMVRAKDVVPLGVEQPFSWEEGNACAHALAHWSLRWRSDRCTRTVTGFRPFLTSLLQRPVRFHALARMKARTEWCDNLWQWHGSKEKLDIARQLHKLGVDIIEAGFPCASPDDLNAVRQIAQTVGNDIDESRHGYGVTRILT